MIKKIISILIQLVLILSLAACGGGGSNVSVVKNTKSKINGDFLFYVKNDNGTYYTNCEDIEETKLSDKGIELIYLDEKRNNIIYFDYVGIFVKPIKNDSETIMIDNCSTYLPIIDNKYIVYTNDRLFVYDLDSKKKTVISENYVSTYQNYNGKITYLEKVDNKTYKICTYDLKSKSKSETVLEDGFRDLKIHFLMTDGVIYYYITGKVENDIRETILYKTVAGKKTEIIDSIVSEVRHYNKKDGKSASSSLGYSLVECYNNGGFYFRKDISFKEFNYKNYYYEKEQEYYYYDGKNINLIDEAKSISETVKASGKIDNFVFYIDRVRYYWYNGEMDKAIANCSLKTDGNKRKAGFLIGNKVYEGNIECISRDLNLIAYNVINPDTKQEESYILNIQNDTTQKLNWTIEEVMFFDNDNLLYRTFNRDVILNNEVIDYKYNDNYSEYNGDLSTILYTTNSGLCMYKDGNVNILSSNAKVGHITNNNNVYYVSDNNLYVYKNEEAIIAATDVWRIYDVESKVPGYKIIR